MPLGITQLSQTQASNDSLSIASMSNLRPLGQTYDSMTSDLLQEESVSEQVFGDEEHSSIATSVKH